MKAGQTIKPELNFISGGGEMGQLIREKDWSLTSLGDSKFWPQSLKTSLSIILNSRIPHFLMWGKDLTCFYNDAFRPSLGVDGKHPSMLGKKGEEGWSEIWEIISPWINSVLTTGEPVWLEDQLVPFYRNGKMEDIYWTFCYSAVADESGKNVGVFVTCNETTEKFASYKKLEESERKLRLTIDKAPIAIAILRGKNYVIEVANDHALEIWGRKEEEVLNKALFEAMPELASQEIKSMFDQVFTSGKTFSATELPVQLLKKGKLDTVYVNFSYGPLYNADGKIDGVMPIGFDVTEQVKARLKVEINEEKLNVLINASELGTFELNLKTDYVDCSERFHEIFGYGREYKLSHAEFISHLHPEDVIIRNAAFAEAMKTGTLLYQSRIISKDGSERWIEVKGTLFRDTEKKPSVLIGTCADITKERTIHKILEDNQEKLNIVIDASQLGVWELDMLTRKPTYSKRYLEIIGGYKEDVVLTHEQLLAHLHPDDMPIREQAFKDAFATGYLFYQSRLIWNDGSVHWMEGRGKVFYDEKNNPIKLMGTLRDITEEKKHEKELEESEHKFRLLADSMPQHIWTSDTEGNLNYFNKSVFDYSGLTPEELIRVGWIDIVHPDDREENIKAWTNSITTGKDFIFEHRFRRHDGSYRWQLSRAIPQKNAQGKIQMWVGTSTDIDDKKAIEVKLDKLVKERTFQLERSNEDLQQFAHVASHDLKEPLRKIKIFTNRLKDEHGNSLPENGNQFLEKIIQSSTRMQMMIDGVLSFSSINSTEQPIQLIDLNEVVKNVRTDLEIIFEQKSAKLEVDKLPSIEGAEILIHQLFYNLIKNALKFSKEGEPPYIQLTSTSLIENGEEVVNIKIEDNGIGFEQQYAKKIFETFTRLNAKDKYEGTGLGLTLCQKIVERHRGKITATSKLNEGATFIIALPVKQSETNI